MPQSIFGLGLCFRRSRIPVLGFRVIWVIVVLWFELGIFFYSAQTCRWPGANQNHISTEYTSTHRDERESLDRGADVHILIVADPQILDHRSYPGRSPFFTFLTRLVVDLNLRKSWRAALRTRPHAVVLLGDMMDGGRFAMSDREYESYFRRFKSIFKADKSLPVYYVTGNHDVGLGVSEYFSENARNRFRHHFGPLNHGVLIGNHTILFIDAPGLVEEDFQRRGHSLDYEQWKPLPNGTVEFVKSVTQAEQIYPTVLFTHIPLSRPDGSSCGGLREKGTIRAGTGFGYHNTLGPTVTEFLLKQIKPTVVFSGDDHDYCEYDHHITLSNGSSSTVREVTVKSISMVMGIRKPGFQLLSLTSRGAAHEMPPNRLCILPDQFGIYLSTYIPLLAFSLVVLLVSNFYRARTVPRRTRLSPSHVEEDDTVWISSTLMESRDVRLRIDPEGGTGDQWTHSYSPEEVQGLPPPVITPPHSGKLPIHKPAWSFILFGRRRRIKIPQICFALIRNITLCCTRRRRRPQRGRVRMMDGFVCDVRDAAWLPLGVFTLIAGWMFLGP